jgi:hypothetical protein
MPRPRRLDAHAREFFAFTEELLTTPERTIDCGTLRKAFALRASTYHFWATFRRVVEEGRHRPAEMDSLAWGLVNAGKLRDGSDGSTIRALYRVAANTSIVIEGTADVRFIPKSATTLASILAENLARPPEPLDGGAGLLAELTKGD